MRICPFKGHLNSIGDHIVIKTEPRAFSIKKRKEAPFLTFSVICENGSVIATLPIKTVSEGNCNENWRKRHARHKSQKEAVRLALNPHLSKISLPCQVTLTRYAPRLLDEFENLPMSFKWIYDTICDCLIPGLQPGRADEDKRIKVKACQEKSKLHGVRIEITY